MRTVRLPLHSDDDRGVSPVIGVILMVAITVILAAVIASFVLGFGSSVSKSVQAGADITEKDDGTARVTWISEGNAVQLNVTVSDATGTAQLTSVGDSVTIKYDSSAASNSVTNSTITLNSTDSTTVTVTAVGSGGSKTVVAQRTVDLEDQA